ncbi:aminopeptidase [Candidatus Woesearchaeota archaeon]|nr:aminopeptidase [Candidatus Woesearchaeota archaeon]
MGKTEKNIVDKVYCDLLKVKKSEKILIVCDKKTKKIAEMFFEDGFVFGDSTLCIEVPEGKQNGEEPHPEISKLLLKYDVLLLITTKSLTHTNAVKKATEKGARAITMPGIQPATLKRCIDISYKDMQELHNKIYKRMKDVKVVRVTTKIGTDISFSIYNDKIFYKTSMHNKGDLHNLPIGEVYTVPKEGSAEGVYVVDASQAGVGLLKKPIKITVKKGMAVKIEGGADATKLEKVLKSVKDKKAYNIAELGIGTNPKAKITGNILEDEKVISTCHIALGNNYGMGGKVNVPIHLDGIMKKPTIYFDDKIIMKNGKFTF